MAKKLCCLVNLYVACEACDVRLCITHYGKWIPHERQFTLDQGVCPIKYHYRCPTSNKIVHTNVFENVKCLPCEKNP